MIKQPKGLKQYFDCGNNLIIIASCINETNNSSFPIVPVFLNLAYFKEGLKRHLPVIICHGDTRYLTFL